MSQLFRRKAIAELLVEGESPYALKRALGAGDLVMLGIGAVIGAGIFGAIGTAAAGQYDAAGHLVRSGAGPALVLSFLFLGVACALAGLCYAELAAMIPQAGSAYAYSYATLGEIVAWIIGWDLIRGRQRGGRDLLGRLLHLAAAELRRPLAGVAHDRIPHGAAVS